MIKYIVECKKWFEDKNNHDLIREKIYFSCADVTRKKDL